MRNVRTAEQPHIRSPGPFMSTRDSFRSELSRRLRLARERAGLEQEQVAALVGRSAKTVWNWESPGEPGSLPRMDELAVLAREFRVSLDWLVRPEIKSDETAEEETWSWIVDEDHVQAALRSVSSGDACWQDTPYFALSEGCHACYSHEEMLQLEQKLSAHLAHVRRAGGKP